ncbi:TIGR04283 family arsenosugar biosynthesis glycosyltransferase [Pyruvatibacter sp.]|uniref:TIGR04283 family arsenosugar biosynthesis glycosyltransferase n=1 Tax=Pyruvatibacter sp. TaxID=1981328 RepID=UPI00326574FA
MQFSIIIPTLNEAPRIAALVERVRDDEPECEIIVVDGGSSDDTAVRAREAGACVLVADRGRGAQLSHGASAAHGDILVFLHADTVWPAGAFTALRRELSGAGVIGGNFRLVFDGDTQFADWLTGFYAWFRGHGLYYGDSVIFVRRDIYQSIGGIRPMPVMEDFDLRLRMERNGGTVCVQDPPIVTSSRRFKNRHPVAIFMHWLLVHGLYYAGLSNGRLIAWVYDTERRRTADS